MRIFVTGATGLVGSAIVTELLGAGHEVVGLARSETTARTLAARGVTAHRGSLTNLPALRAGAEQADAVIHTAFVHDFARFEAAVAIDRDAVETFGAALAGTGKPLLITSGTPGPVNGDPSTEDTVPAQTGSPVLGRFVTEQRALSYVDEGVRVSVVRLPRSVHGAADRHGFVPSLIAAAREKGVSAYVDDGETRWCAVHQLDAAHLYRLAVENGVAGARWHAVADEAIPTRALAETIGRRLGVPVRSIPAEAAVEHFGFLGGILATDQATSSVRTRQRLGWEPTRDGLLADLEQGHYFA